MNKLFPSPIPFSLDNITRRAFQRETRTIDDILLVFIIIIKDDDDIEQYLQHTHQKKCLFFIIKIY